MSNMPRRQDLIPIPQPPPDPMVTMALIKVLAMLSKHDKLACSEIADHTEMKTGVIHPILQRLEVCLWITSEIEKGNPHQLGRRLKIFYKLTPRGKHKIDLLFAELKQTIN